MTAGLRTIRARVALATFAVLAAVLGVAGLVVDRAVRASALAALDARLASEAEAIAAVTSIDRGRIEVDFEGEALPSFAAPGGGAYFQVVAQRGVVERSRSLRDAKGGLPPPAAADLGALPPGAHRTSYAVVPGPHEPSVRLVTHAFSRSPDDEDDEPGAAAPRVTLAVQVARSLAEVDQAAARTRGALLLALPLALVLGTAGASAVAGRATRPIERLARDARAIGAGATGARLDAGRIEGELRDLAETLNAAFDRLASALERERRLAADAAHELRTPIALARARLELVLSKDREPEAYRDSSRAALEAIDRLERIVEGLLLLGRAEAGRFARERVDLRGAIARAIEATEPLAARVGATIAVQGGGAELPVAGAPALLERLVASLVENAVRHAGGRIEVVARAHDGRAEVDVLDRGPGFPPDLVPRLFERFARGDASRARETGGTGLGLAIARTTARAHGGDVTAGAREGGGAAVRIVLPLEGGELRERGLARD